MSNKSNLATPERLNIAVVATASEINGGAERFNRALVAAVESLGHRVELVSLPAPEPSFEAIMANYQRFAALDLSAFDAVISTKSPSYAVQHPNHVVYLVHTVRAFDDMFESLFAPVERDMAEKRRQLHGRDLEALGAARRIYTIGHEVSGRLFKWRGLTSEVLHPPLAVQGFSNAGQGDYFFMPGRLHAWKRVALAVEAVLASDRPMKLVISGTGEEEQALKELAGGDPRIEFLGHISDEQLLELYAGALAVPFVPLREDYGYVTLEAFASEKPVLTCTDSGEPTYFVRHGETGLICEPSAQGVRHGLEWLFDNREAAAEMGRAGRQLIDAMNWQEVAAELVAAAVGETPARSDKARCVATLDMQPIDPPVGGGRLRLLGLYHDLGDDLTCHYVGSYDWPDEPFRDHWLSPGLREISVPLSDAHHAAAAALGVQCNGKTVIDLAFSQQGMMSPEFVERVRKEVARADVVVFSHPWVYPLVRDCLQPRHVVVYDSQNVEGYLRAQLLDESNPPEAALLRKVVADEYDLGSRADLILACSHEDLLRFNRIYEFDPASMRVIPNGVMAFEMLPPSAEQRVAIRRKLGLAEDAFIAIFIGSPYGPNRDAADFIVQRLAPALPGVTFVVAGGVGEAVSSRGKNVVCTGRIDEEGKRDWLRAADMAVNPMFSGSGTNIKMFDFMAVGLPVVVTETGARGIAEGMPPCYLQVAASETGFVEGIQRLQHDAELRQTIGQEARRQVETGYSWERISRHLGNVLRNQARWAGQRPPTFSVIVPSYERHGKLAELMTALAAQIERDFEVIIVDQSASRWPDEHRSFGIPVTYIHTRIKGAVPARNTGAAVAAGRILAFTDDDCLPEEDWLFNARSYFNNDAVVGVEGMITSDHHGEEEWRPVTNVGLEGLGFMTANLLVRSTAFQLLGGFDMQFDRPHFREDTDFGWRLQELGATPYAEDVAVFHPAQPRSEERESITARSAFFKKDALLYQKHPRRYRELFLMERQYAKIPGFIENLEAGFAEAGLAMPGWMEEELAPWRRRAD